MISLSLIEKRLWELREEYISGFKDFFYGKLNAGKTPLTTMKKGGIKILLKREDFEPTGSLKIRAAAGIHFFLKEKLLTKRTYVSLASSGNFAKDLPYVIKMENLDIPIKVFISEKLKEENPETIEKIEGEIYPVDDDYCPANKRKRGKAITFSKAEEDLFGAVMYNQYEHLGNPFANLLLGEEIAKSVEEPEDILLYIGLGTCGSAIGTYYGFYFLTGVRPELIGVFPQEDHHQLGLRSLSEQGDSEFFKEVKRISKRLIEVHDKDAFNTLVNLWKMGVPSGISTGSNIAAILKNDDDSPAVTLMPDSIKGMNYKTFLRRHFEKILGIRLEETSYNNHQQEINVYA